MRHFSLKMLTALTLYSTAASGVTLYGDPATGRIYYKPGEGRVKIEEPIKSEATKAEKIVSDKNHSITVLDQKSPEFLLGKQTKVNMKFVPEDAPDMWFKAGVRVQGTFDNRDTTKYNADGSTKSSSNIDDAFLRRVRLEVSAGFGKHSSFTMDLRNDKANFGVDNNERTFNVGDAYVKISKPFDNSLVNFKLYRAKINISRTETVKSAYLIAYDRPYVADAAAQYISFNRRASNAQIYGDWKKKIHYQAAFGAATNPGKIQDATGVKGSSTNLNLDDQSFFYGGKVILSPFDGWEENKRTETYFGEGKHFSVGAAYWAVPTLKGSVDNGNNSANFDLNRELLNVEVSAHYKGFFIQGEYFKFEDAVRQWSPSAGDVVTGSSSGWYVTSEYVFKDLNYLAPFVRYENWDRFDGESGFDVKSTLLGVNWYLRGNTTKVGLVYQDDEFGVATGNKDVRSIRLTSQWFF